MRLDFGSRWSAGKCGAAADVYNGCAVPDDVVEASDRPFVSSGNGVTATWLCLLGSVFISRTETSWDVGDDISMPLISAKLVSLPQVQPIARRVWFSERFT